MRHPQRLPKIPKKPIDRLLEYLRFRKAKKHIPKDAHLLDIGTGDGTFLRFLNGHIGTGVGIDPLITTSVHSTAYTLLPGTFPNDFIISKRFDVITMLAVVEHIPENELHYVEKACWDYLTQGGIVIITAPHPFADKILAVLKFFGIINGLALEEHYGFDPKTLTDIFRRWTLLKKERWELGCNYLFVFLKPKENHRHPDTQS